jgi:hypothetical protein
MQLVQLDEPLEEDVPAAQLKQTVEASAADPEKTPYVPPAQSVHDDEPTTDAKLPGAHATQLVEPLDGCE